MAEIRTNTTIPTLDADSTRAGSHATSRKEGTYRVLATLIVGEQSYRVFADMTVSTESAYLRFHRFDLPDADDWMAERKISVPVIQPDIAPLEKKFGDVEFILCFPVRLDELRARAVFGQDGPPAT